MLDRTIRGNPLRRGDWKVSELIIICTTLGRFDLVWRDASIIPAAAICSGLNEWIAGATASTTECLVCGEQFPSTERLETHCWHIIDYCAKCTETWLSTQLKLNAPTAVYCPADDCLEKLAPEDFEGYLPFDVVCRVKMQYFAALLRGFICPAESCGTMISENDQLSFVNCGSCRLRVCMSCRSAWHSGITCEQYQTDLVQRSEDQAIEDERIAEEAEAEERAREEENRQAREAEDRLQVQRTKDENASTRYKQAQTTSCPGCGVPIQKNGGCDHITCSMAPSSFQTTDLLANLM